MREAAWSDCKPIATSDLPKVRALTIASNGWPQSSQAPVHPVQRRKRARSAGAACFRPMKSANQSIAAKAIPQRPNAPATDAPDTVRVSIDKLAQLVQHRRFAATAGSAGTAPYRRDDACAQCRAAAPSRKQGRRAAQPQNHRRSCRSFARSAALRRPARRQPKRCKRPQASSTTDCGRCGFCRRHCCSSHRIGRCARPAARRAKPAALRLFGEDVFLIARCSKRSRRHCCTWCETPSTTVSKMSLCAKR